MEKQPKKPTKSKPKQKRQWPRVKKTWDSFAELGPEYALTAIVGLFVANGLVTWLVMSDKLEISADNMKISGAITFAYAIYVAIVAVNKGVRYQVKAKKKGKK